MNIIWKKPDETIAITFIFEDNDPVDHAKELLEKGSVPADWVPVTHAYPDPLPTEPQDYWRWDGKKVHTPPELVIQAHNDGIDAEITEIERVTAMSRPVRDMMLATLKGAARDKVAAVDSQIVTLRGKKK